jgi:hypothetical protein
MNVKVNNAFLLPSRSSYTVGKTEQLLELMLRNAFFFEI